MTEVRIATFNLAGAVDSDSRFYSRKGNRRTSQRARQARRALDDVVEAVRRENIEIVALQEVDVCHSGADTLHQADYLARALGMRVAFSPGFDYDFLGRVSVTTGVATLSAFDIERSSEVRFPQRHVGVSRWLRSRVLGAKRALDTQLRVHGRTISVINAHLTHDRDRQKEMELGLLLELAASRRPCLLMGDLNTTPESTRSAGMREPGHFATDRCQSILRESRAQTDPRLTDPARVREICSYPSSAPDIKLDYIYLFPDANTRLGPETVLEPIGASNHRAVVATLES